jgi:protein-S-isoprenylcysteine O-methyltransferase Ste14
MATTLVAAQFVLIAVILACGALPLQSAGPAAALAAGIALGLWTLLHNRPGNFNIRPVPKDTAVLITGGPYHWVRHPMYVALLLVMAAVAGAAPHMLAGWLALLALAAVLAAKAALEERLLRQAYPGYAEYATRTHRFIPGVY